MTTSILQGRRALVTGASSGLGADFARYLARLGCNLILVARREDRLQATKDEINRRYPVDIQIITADLSNNDAPQMLYDQIKQMGLQVDVLINNAGYGLFGAFTEIPWEKEHDMLEVDMIAVVHLTKLFLPDMLARNFGYILNVASIGAYQPSPLYASYSAAKSFVLNFSEAVSYELRSTNVHCTVISPGITATEFLQVSGQEATKYQRMAMMRSAEVARIGIEAMLKGKPSVVPGYFNAVMAWSNRLIPRRLSAAIAERLMR